MKTSNEQATTPESLQIKIDDFKCSTWNSFLYKHWKKGWKAKTDIEEQIYWETLEQLHGTKVHFQKVKITIRAEFKGKAKHDPDNLFVKPMLDGLVKAGIFPDDNGEVIRSLTLESRHGHKKDSVCIIIEKIL